MKTKEEFERARQAAADLMEAQAEETARKWVEQMLSRRALLGEDIYGGHDQDRFCAHRKAHDAVVACIQKALREAGWEDVIVKWHARTTNRRGREVGPLCRHPQARGPASVAP